MEVQVPDALWPDAKDLGCLTDASPPSAPQRDWDDLQAALSALFVSVGGTMELAETKETNNANGRSMSFDNATFVLSKSSVEDI